MKVSQAARFFMGASIICLAAGLIGCSSGGQAKQSVAAVETLQSAKQEVGKAKEQVGQTMAAMNTLSAGAGDLTAAHKAFAKEVAETEKTAADARKRATAMRERGDQYIEAWEKEMKEVANPELRAGAAERRATVRENYDKIRGAAQGAREAYEPFMKDLKDIQAAMAMDLTPAGVQAAKPAFDKARTQGETLIKKLDELTAELDRVSAGLTPAK